MEYIKVGKVKDAHGLKGELYILLFAKGAPWMKQLKAFQLTPESGASRILKVKSAKPHKDGLIVATEELKDRNQSEAVKGLAFEIPKKLLVSKKGETPYLIEVLGFEVFEGQNQLGLVQSFSTNNEQDLLVVESATRFFEIPFVDAFIVSINYESKKIEMQIPDGLLELCGYDK